ncbi:hypothetical protein NP493_4711g00000 [Ridgeia piscesae]|uniref:Uncharacterized protein n=1 Tax=Ridgeia piscesae TaxID=27915 RepID=A0AAD9IXT8_RIDPI|nr:hypothetical protein NP493_4711g00000 [Ridgeia piscesae]
MKRLLILFILTTALLTKLCYCAKEAAARTEYKRCISACYDKYLKCMRACRRRGSAKRPCRYNLSKCNKRCQK